MMLALLNHTPLLFAVCSRNAPRNISSGLDIVVSESRKLDVFDSHFYTSSADFKIHRRNVVLLEAELQISVYPRFPHFVITCMNKATSPDVSRSRGMVQGQRSERLHVSNPKVSVSNTIATEDCYAALKILRGASRK